MSTAVFFFITWFISSVFFVIHKKLSIVENTFIFLLILVVNINFSWIIIEELHLIRLTDDPIKYTAYLLNRSILTPILLITQLNLFKAGTIFRNSTLLVPIISIGIMLGISILSRYFEITEYKEWYLIYDALYFSVLHLIAFYSYKQFNKLATTEVRYR